MTIHTLKAWPEPFEAVLLGYKTHEVRKHDRDYKVGDVLLLQEWVPDIGEAEAHRIRVPVTGRYTGRTFDVRVTYITPGSAFGLPENLCVMSIRGEVSP